MTRDFRLLLLTVLVLPVSACPRPAHLDVRWHLVQGEIETEAECQRVVLMLTNTGSKPIPARDVFVEGREQCCSVPYLEPGRVVLVDLGEFRCRLPTDVRACAASVNDRGAARSTRVDVDFKGRVLSSIPWQTEGIPCQAIGGSAHCQPPRPKNDCRPCRDRTETREIAKACPCSLPSDACAPD